MNLFDVCEYAFAHGAEDAKVKNIEVYKKLKHDYENDATSDAYIRGFEQQIINNFIKDVEKNNEK